MVWQKNKRISGLKRAPENPGRPYGVCVATFSFAPSGLGGVPLSTHGLRPGLDSSAASRLPLSGTCSTVIGKIGSHAHAKTHIFVGSNATTGSRALPNLFMRPVDQF